MIKLLKAELYKIFHFATFKVISILTILHSIISLIIISPVVDNIIKKSLPPDTTVSYVKTGFEVATIAYDAQIIAIFISILCGIMVATEYSSGTLKNILAYGKNRISVYLSKFLSISIAIGVITLIRLIIITIGATIINGWGQKFEFHQLGMIVKSFMFVMIAYCTISAIIMLIATIVKSNGSVVAIGCSLFTLGYSLLYNISCFNKINKWLTKFYKITVFYVNDILNNSLSATASQVRRETIIAIITISLSLIIGIIVFQKQDVK